MSDAMMILASGVLGLCSALALRPFRTFCVVEGRFSSQRWGVFMLLAVAAGFGACVKMLMSYYDWSRPHLFGRQTALVIWFLFFAVFVPVALRDMLKFMREHR